MRSGILGRGRWIICGFNQTKPYSQSWAKVIWLEKCTCLWSISMVCIQEYMQPLKMEHWIFLRTATAAGNSRKVTSRQCHVTNTFCNFLEQVATSGWVTSGYPAVRPQRRPAAHEKWQFGAPLNCAVHISAAELCCTFLPLNCAVHISAAHSFAVHNFAAHILLYILLSYRQLPMIMPIIFVLHIMMLHV